jgi:hypothetical protein
LCQPACDYFHSAVKGARRFSEWHRELLALALDRPSWVVAARVALLATTSIMPSW